VTGGIGGGSTGSTTRLGSRVHDYYVYADEAEDQEWTALFEPVVSGSEAVRG
jgi:hypothetical protein